MYVKEEWVLNQNSRRKSAKHVQSHTTLRAIDDRKWRGTRVAFIMLTERRLEQWPHVTVTAIDKLLHGTLTCTSRRNDRPKEHEESFTWIKPQTQWRTPTYQQNGGTDSTLHITNLFRQIKEMVHCIGNQNLCVWWLVLRRQSSKYITESVVRSLVLKFQCERSY